MTPPAAALAWCLSAVILIVPCVWCQPQLQGNEIDSFQRPSPPNQPKPLQPQVSPANLTTIASTASHVHNNVHTSEQLVSHKSPLNGRQFGDMINDVHIECLSESIKVTLATSHGFNGMIYPKGLSKNSTCMSEYHQTGANITYFLPLRSCNTMSADVEDGVEYFNTVMVQPHRRLVTNQGRGYHIRCRYQTKERTITNLEQQLSVNLTQVSPAVVGQATMPQCQMRIYSANEPTKEISAENVRIGDELQLVVSLDDQDVYGMLVTNCLVRDGMNWGEQPLIDDNGCPIDEDIMPQFEYAKNLTRATVTFQAHKFPYTSSVYYQCNIRLCFRDSAGCQHVPPNCDRRFGTASGSLAPKPVMAVEGELRTQPQSQQRHRRWVDAGELDASAPADLLATPSDSRAMSIEVYSGLHVTETEPAEAKSGTTSGDSASPDQDPMMLASTNERSSALRETEAETSSPDATGSASDATASDEQGGQRGKSARDRQSERDFCMSLRKLAIAISLASLLLMLAILFMLAMMIRRRNRQRRLEQQMHDQERHHHADIQRDYDGHYHSNTKSYFQGHQPYAANQAYCRD